MTAKQRFLRDLMGQADQLREDASYRRPFWRERKAGQRTVAVLSNSGVVREFIEVVGELDDNSYFEKRFGKDCVDSGRANVVEALLERELCVPGLWPLDRERLVADMDLFFDIVELLHDPASRPLERSLHSYAGCGWHHSTFDIESGRVL